MTEKIPRESPHGHCIFCEDIRQEVNGKETHVGVFSGPDLFVSSQQLPTHIGKFIIKIYYAQRPSDIVVPVTIQVTLPGDVDGSPSASVEINVPALVRDFPAPAPELEDPFMAVQTAFVFDPLEIKQEGLIEVRAIRADKSYRLGALRVRRNPALVATETKEAAN